jgi:hypothetical protein
MRPIVIVMLLAAAAGAEEYIPPPPAAAATPTMTPPATGQKKNGFALELRVGTQLAIVPAAGGGAVVGAFGGGIFAGYKLDRVIFGIGFDIARVASSMSMPGMDTSQATTAFFFAPGIRVAIVRSQDQRVELFGQFDLGLGTRVNEQSPAAMGPQPDETRFNLYYNIGPGVRFWVHPQFAVGAVGGVHGDFSYFKQTDPQTNISQSQSTTVTSIFAALQLTGVF